MLSDSFLNHKIKFVKPYMANVFILPPKVFTINSSIKPMLAWMWMAERSQCLNLGPLPFNANLLPVTYIPIQVLLGLKSLVLVLLCDSSSDQPHQNYGLGYLH